MTQPELELDESEMFGDGEESGDETTVLQAPAGAGEATLLSALASSASASAGAAASSESESDDDGIRLDTEPSSSGARDGRPPAERVAARPAAARGPERPAPPAHADEKEEGAEEARGMLISPAHSKGAGPLSPGALPAPVPSTSAVGSLHRMGSVGGQREYLSAIDLTSALRESAAIVAPRRRAGTDSPPQLPYNLVRPPPAAGSRRRRSATLGHEAQRARELMPLAAPHAAGDVDAHQYPHAPAPELFGARHGAGGGRDAHHGSDLCAAAPPGERCAPPPAAAAARRPRRCPMQLPAAAAAAAAAATPRPCDWAPFCPPTL